ncbi:MAG: hypothetical protein KGN34_02815 [Sphingomonadales bacterium]|nr:hypothetical protein [Sphingomonadales bacterium]
MFRKIFAAAALALLPAMPAFAAAYVSPAVVLTNASGTTLQNVYTVPSGSNGFRLTGIFCTNNGAANEAFIVGLTSGSTNSAIFVTNAAVNNITTGTGITNIMQTAVYGTNPTVTTGLPVDESGNSYYPVSAGDTITLTMTGAVDSGKTIACRFTGAVM